MFTRRTRHVFALASLTAGAMIVLAPAASATQQNSMGLEDVVMAVPGIVTAPVSGVLHGGEDYPGLDSVVESQKVPGGLLPSEVLGR